MQFHNRLHLYPIFRETARHLKEDFDIVTATVSSFYPRLSSDLHLYFPHNSPYGRKRNLAASLALNTKADLYISIAEDHYISKEVVQAYVDHKADFAGLLDISFYDLETDKAMYLEGYEGKHKGGLMGLGKCYSRAFLKELRGQIVGEVDVTMDGSNDEIIKKSGVTPLKLRAKDLGGVTCDFKTGNTLNPYDKIKKKWDCPEVELQLPESIWKAVREVQRESPAG